ncbi:hypothetical protein ACWWJF_20865 [Symbiopectobacterium sp. Eva_TO]
MAKQHDSLLFNKASKRHKIYIIIRCAVKPRTLGRGGCQDCKSCTVKYLGTGDTLEQMKKSSPDKSMAPIVGESIAYYVGLEACK